MMHFGNGDKPNVDCCKSGSSINLAVCKTTTNYEQSVQCSNNSKT